MSQLSRLIGSRTVEVEELTEVPLLEKCRLPSDADADLQPVWLIESSSDPRPVWIPRGAAEGESREALIVEASGLEEWELTLTLWNRYRGPDPVEAGMVLEHLEVGPRGRHRLLDLLELPNADEVLDAYRQFPALPTTLRDPLRDGDLSPRLFRYLQRVPDDLEADLIDLLAVDTRVLSVQDTRRLSEALRRLPPEKYDDFREQVNYPDEDRSPRDVGEELLESARRLAYPEVAKRRKDYEEDVTELDLDGRIDVSPPKNFEGDYLDVSLRCHRGESLEKLAEEVKKCQKLLEHV